MSKFALLIITFLLANSLGLAGNGKEEKNELKWLSFDAAQTTAAKEKKRIFVDVYTDWCKWCKKLDTDTYADPKVMKYLQDRFVSVKINPEMDGQVTVKGKKITNNTFAQQFGVRGYPTLLFFESNGDLITGLSSFLKADDFLNVAQFIGEGKYEKMTWEEYMKGKSAK